MTPIFRLRADAADITANILPCLISLTLTDNAGDQADTLTLVLADKGRATVVPQPDTILKLALGYKGGVLRDMGSYAVDEVKWSDPPPQFSLTARSVAHSDQGTPAKLPPMQTKKTRSWEAGTRLADMVAKIAEEHALTHLVGASLQPIVLPHTDQTGETDLNLLSRLVTERGGWVKVVHNTLVLVTVADAKEAAKIAPVSSAPRPLEIGPGQYTRIDWTNKKRQHFRRVIATYRDIEAATDRQIIAGDTDPNAPTDILRKPYPDEQTAAIAATARLEQVAREGASMNVTLPAPTDMSPSADAPVIIKNIFPQINGQWMPKTVTWTLSRSGGLSVAISCETDSKK